ncbi:MAG: flagellar hook-associated protein FlgL [Gammaproteobacteria bacterium]
MRVSSNQTQLTAINAMLEQQAKLSAVQQQVATGKRISKPSDDPVAASKIVNLKDVMSTTEQYQSNIDGARSRLTIEEGVLANAVEVLQRARELAVAGNNGSQTNETRSFIAEEVDQLAEELLGLANTTDSSGEFLFAGAKSKFKPFVRNEQGAFEYHGDDTQRFIQIGPKRRIPTNDSGTDTFRAIREGNGNFVALDYQHNRGSGVIDPGNISGHYDQQTYAIVFDRQQSIDPNEPLTYTVINAKGEAITEPRIYVDSAAIEFRGVHTFVKGEPAAGDFFVIRPSYSQDIFTTLDRFTQALREGRGTPAQLANLHNEMNRVITNLDQGLGRLLETRSNVGARLNALDSQEKINEAYKHQIKEILSNVEDLDYGEAVSRLNLRLTGLEASQKAFTRVQGISLFNFL